MTERLRVVCAAIALLATADPALAAVPPAAPPGVAASSGDAAYAAIEKAYFAQNFKANPVAATMAGIHADDARLGSFGARDYAAFLATDRAYLAKLDALDRATLAPEVALDAKMLENALRDDLVINGELEVWRHNPDLYVNLASGGVYAVVERAYAPVRTRARYAIARERAIPALVAQAEANLTGSDATTARLAADDARGSERFFSTTVPQALGNLGDPALAAELARADAVAQRAMASFAVWIERHLVAHPSGTYAIGAKAYSKRLKYEEALDIPLAAYLKTGEDALAATRAEFVAVAKTIDPGKSPEAVAEAIKRIHPTAAKLLPAAQNDLAALRAFIVAHNILTLPPEADIKVVETPVFQRQTTFASMDTPGPLESVATQAFYNVTPVDTTKTVAEQNDYLGFFNNFNRPIVSAHEVYPGHYVNFTIDKHLPLSLTRRMLWTASFGEGWAHYDEQMIVDEGWGGGDPRVRLAQLGGALVRECRYVVGVREHTAGMTVDEATTFFMQNAFMARDPARREALRGTQDATYGYYTLGKLEILKLRADMQKKLGPAFSLQAFHDDLLAHGDPPIPLLRPLLLGSSDDGKVL
ncbi:MAG: DUF885 domain-containing protein [Vulcanimicrobiaceae bacterium]